MPKLSKREQILLDKSLESMKNLSRLTEEQPPNAQGVRIQLVLAPFDIVNLTLTPEVRRYLVEFIKQVGSASKTKNLSKYAYISRILAQENIIAKINGPT